MRTLRFCPKLVIHILILSLFISYCMARLIFDMLEAFFFLVNKLFRIDKFITVKPPNHFLIITFSSSHLFGHRLSQLQSFRTGSIVPLHVVSAAFSPIQTCFSSRKDDIPQYTHSLPITCTSLFHLIQVLPYL